MLYETIISYIANGSASSPAILFVICISVPFFTTGVIVAILFLGCWLWGFIDDTSVSEVYKSLNKYAPTTYEEGLLTKSKALKYGSKYIREDPCYSTLAWYEVERDVGVVEAYGWYVFVGTALITLLPAIYHHFAIPAIILLGLVGLIFLARLARRTGKILNNHIADKEAHNGKL